MAKVLASLTVLFAVSLALHVMVSMILDRSGDTSNFSTLAPFAVDESFQESTDFLDWRLPVIHSGEGDLNRH
jgi:hypothetical protein